MKPKEFWKKIKFTNKGYGKVRVRPKGTTLQKLKGAFENGDYERWLMKNDSKEEREAVKHLSKEIQESLDREVVEAFLKEQEEERMKKVLEEISTKVGKDEQV